MNDIFVLMNKATNGFGYVVVGVAPGSNPHGPLVDWMQRQHYKYPGRAAEEYVVVDRLENATTVEGVIAVAEWFDGALSHGRALPRNEVQ